MAKGGYTRGEDFSQRRKRRRSKGVKSQYVHEHEETKERGKLVDRLRKQGLKLPDKGETASERARKASALAESILSRSRKKKKKKKSGGKSNRDIAAAYNAIAGRLGGGGSDRGSRNQ